MFKQEVLYDKPSYIGASVLDLSNLHMMRFHYEVIHKNLEGSYNLIYTDTDSLVYDIRHHASSEWISENCEHFDSSNSNRPDLQDNSNKKVFGKFKCEVNIIVIIEFLALSPKSYMYNYQTLDERTGTSKKLKWQSKTVIKKDIKFEDYLKTLTTNKLVKNRVVSIRSLNHQLHTLNQPKIALTSFYDKCCSLNEVDCTTFGYLGNW